MIERIRHAVNAIYVLDMFSSCYTVISAVSQAYVAQLLHYLLCVVHDIR